VESGEPISLPTISSEDDASLEVSIDDDGLLVEDARITTADILTRNGVIHVIDRVLLPASD